MKKFAYVALVATLATLALRPAASANNVGLDREATLHLLDDLGITVNGHFGGGGAPTGAAGGSLGGTYPNPTLSNPLGLASSLANNNDVATFTKSPAGAQTGSALVAIGNANTTDPAFLVKSGTSDYANKFKVQDLNGNDFFTVGSETIVRNAIESFSLGGNGNALWTLDCSNGNQYFYRDDGSYQGGAYIWRDVAGTPDTYLTSPATGVLTVGTTFHGTDGTWQLPGSTGAGTLAPTWTNSPTSLTGARNPYTWLKFIASDGQVVWVAAFK